MLRPGSVPSATPNKRCAAGLASRISPSAVMVSTAAGLLSIRNSSCSSAARRARISCSAPPGCPLRGDSPVTARDNNPAVASVMKIRMSRGTCMSIGNGSSRSERNVQNAAASSSRHHPQIVPSSTMGNM